MSDRDFDAVFYVKRAPTIRFEDGMFTVCYTVGRSQLEFVFSPNTFLKMRQAAGRIVDEFHERTEVSGIKDGH